MCIHCVILNAVWLLRMHFFNEKKSFQGNVSYLFHKYSNNRIVKSIFMNWLNKMVDEGFCETMLSQGTTVVIHALLQSRNLLYPVLFDHPTKFDFYFPTSLRNRIHWTNSLTIFIVRRASLKGYISKCLYISVGNIKIIIPTWKNKYIRIIICLVQNIRVTL